MNSLTRSLLATLLAAFLVAIPAFAFQSPLSDESVRDAYFLGQRHDGTSSFMLEKYIKRLPAPSFGPHISSVSFLTPFIQLVEYSDRYIGNYSAQQALLDHRGKEESVKVTVEIYLTNSYGAMIANPAASRSSSSQTLIPRPYDFWRDFRVQAFDAHQIISPSTFGGHLIYRCGRVGPCRPIGAIIDLEFPGDAFTSDSVTVQVIPPEGDPVFVDFDPARLR